MRRILLATDFSDGARQALNRAVRLAMQTSARLDVIHAAPDDVSDGAALHSRLIQEAQLAAARAGASGIEIRSVVSLLEPEKAILQRAERTEPDLIVLGGHGKPRFRDAVFGTTGTHVVRHSAVPVLIVQTDPSLPYQKLMVAADRPDAAPRLVEGALAIAPDAEVFAVHAFDIGLVDQLGGADAVDHRAAREVGAMRTELAGISALHPGALIEAHRHLIAEPGSAITVMMHETERLVPDLVVMGTRHRGTYLGSRAVDACFWCPADLLIVPEPTPVPADA